MPDPILTRADGDRLVEIANDLCRLDIQLQQDTLSRLGGSKRAEDDVRYLRALSRRAFAADRPRRGWVTDTSFPRRVRAALTGRQL